MVDSERYGEATATASNPAGRPEEGRGADRERSQGKGRARQSRDEAKETQDDLGLAPRGLISLWDMLKRYAEDFYQLGGLLGHIREWLRQEPQPLANLQGDAKDVMATAIVSAPLDSLVERLDAINLDFSVKAVSRLKELLDKDSVKKTVVELAQAVEDIDRRIRDELEARYLLFVAEDKARHYNAFQDGWVDAISRFNGITTDVEEAEKCFALGRYSACVFHLMRVAEIGVQEMGRRLKLPAWKIQEPWGKIIKAIHDAVLTMPHKTTAQKSKQQKWSLLADALFQVNLAWRIPTEHPRVPGEVYTEEQADEALASVKALLRHLAIVI